MIDFPSVRKVINLIEKEEKEERERNPILTIKMIKRV
jgi:hypothetical protein